MSNRSVYIFFILGFLLYQCHIKMFAAPRAEPAERYLSCLTYPIDPSTTIIAFDLHDVLFRRNMPEFIGRYVSTMCRGGFFYAINPFFWYNAWRCGVGREITENVYTMLTEEYCSLLRFKDDFYALANAHRPIYDMIEILYQLKQLGYTLYVLSNIGGNTFEAFKIKFPEILNQFKGAYTPNTANNYNHKPRISFYNEFKAYTRSLGDGNKQIIFIDDLKKNIDGAFACNIAGIHCTSTQRVKIILESLQILPKINSIVAIDAIKLTKRPEKL